MSVDKYLIMICEGPFSKRKVAEVEYMNTSSNVAMELDGKRIHYQRKVGKVVVGTNVGNI